MDGVLAYLHMFTQALSQKCVLCSGNPSAIRVASNILRYSARRSDADEPAAATAAPDGDSATQKSAVDAHDASEALRRQLSLGGVGGKPAQTKSKKKDQVQRELHIITVHLSLCNYPNHVIDHVVKCMCGWPQTIAGPNICPAVTTTT